MSARTTIDEIVRDVDPNMARTDPAWGVTAFLLGAMLISTDPDTLAAALEADHAYICDLLRRAAEAGIVVDGEIDQSPYLDDEMGGMTLAMDVSVLLGHMTKSGDKYALTDAGKRHVEGLMK